MKIWTAQYTFRTSWVLDWRLPRWVWQLLHHVLKLSAWFWKNLDSCIYLRSVDKVWIPGFENILSNFTVLIKGCTCISHPVRKLLVEYFFAHRGHLFMILRWVTVVVVDKEYLWNLWSTARLSLHTYQCKQSRTEFRFSFTDLSPNCNILLKRILMSVIFI